MTQFNIPSAINHSCFFDYKNELIHLSEAETNYWYALLYLYRTNLLKENKKQKIFLDNGKKKLNPDFNIFRTKIKLSHFNALGITGNSAYKKLERFLLNLTASKLEVNILGKHREIKSKKINIISSLYIDETNMIHIELSKKLATALLHTKSHFMKVDLDILFKMSGYKAKRLYLLAKDYYNMPNREIEIIKRDLELLIDGIPDNGIFQQVIDNVSDKKVSDISISVEPSEEEFSLDTYIVKFGKLPEKEPKMEEVKSDKPNSNDIKKQLSDFPEEIQNKARGRMENEQSNGTVIKKEESYLISVCKGIVEENEADEEQDLYKAQIDEWLENEKNRLKDTIDTSKYGRPIIKFHTEDTVSENYFWFITKDYLIDRSFEGQPMTKSVKETYEAIEKLYENNNISISNTYVNDNEGKYSKMYF